MSDSHPIVALAQTPDKQRDAERVYRIVKAARDLLGGMQPEIAASRPFGPRRRTLNGPEPVPVGQRPVDRRQCHP